MKSLSKDVAADRSLRLTLHNRREAYPEDISKVQCAVINHGYDCTREEAAALWEAYSDSECAGWLLLEGYSEDGIWKRVEPFIVDLE